MSEIISTQKNETAQSKAFLSAAPQANGEEALLARGGRDDTAQNENPPFLEIRYNHQSKGLSREEAVTLAQKGLKYEGAYNTLSKLAELSGSSVNDYLKQLQDEKSNPATSPVGEEKAESEAEFSEFKKEFPEISDYSALPDEVLKAATSGTPLKEAYLKYKYQELMKINAARQSFLNAESRAVGSMAVGTNGGNTEAEVKFLNALWSK